MDVFQELAAIVGEKYVAAVSDSPKWGADWTGKYTSSPLAIVRPADAQEISQIIKWANVTQTPIVPAAGHTGLNGGTIADGAVLLSVERLNKIHAIRTDARVAIVDAGVILSSLHDASDAQDLVFPLTFGAKGSAMIGGVIGTNAGGSNVLKYGNTRDLVLGVEVVTPTGDIMDLMTELHKDNSGYNLKHLLVGAEGTLGIVTKAALKLHPKPKAYATAMVATNALQDALVLLNDIQLKTGGNVEAFEYMPGAYLDLHHKISGQSKPFDPTYDVNILVEVGTTIDAFATAQDDGSIPIINQLENSLAECIEAGTVLDAVVAKNESQRRAMWERREAAGEVFFSIKPVIDTDVAVPLDKVVAFLDAVTPAVQTVDAAAWDLSVAHLGDGNIHYTVYPSSDDATLRDAIREAVEDVTQRFNGSFSAEHGIGISKLGSMARRKDPAALAAMQAIKSALDPNNILNPGKVIPRA